MNFAEFADAAKVTGRIKDEQLRIIDPLAERNERVWKIWRASLAGTVGNDIRGHRLRRFGCTIKIGAGYGRRDGAQRGHIAASQRLGSEKRAA